MLGAALAAHGKHALPKPIPNGFSFDRPVSKQRTSQDNESVARVAPKEPHRLPLYLSPLGARHLREFSGHPATAFA